VFLKWDIFSDKICRENKTHIMFIIFFLIHSVYETMWEKKGTTRKVTDGNIIRRMHFASRITATRLHVFTIFKIYSFSTATMFPWKLRHKYTACLATSDNVITVPPTVDQAH
jgi:hypothetical protein